MGKRLSPYFIISPHMRTNGILKVRDGKIIDGAAVFYDEKREADIQVDCEGYILSPGFIDIQINGEF